MPRKTRDPVTVVLQPARVARIPRGPDRPGPARGAIHWLLIVAAALATAGCEATKPPPAAVPEPAAAVVAKPAPPTDQPPVPVEPQKPVEPALPPEAVAAAIDEKLAAADTLADEGRFGEAFVAARAAERLARGGARENECAARVASLRDMKREAADLSFALEQLGSKDSLTTDVASRKLVAAGPLGVVLLRQAVREAPAAAVGRSLELLANGPAGRFVADAAARFVAESDPGLQKTLSRVLATHVSEIPPAELAALARRAEVALAAEGAAEAGASLDLFDLLMAVYAGPAGGKAEAFDALVDRPGLAERLSKFVAAASETGPADLARWAGSHLGAFGKVLDYPALVLWLRADRGVDTEGDGIVTAWSDLGPGSVAAAGPPARARAEEPGSRPKLVETDLGPAVEFDGSDDYLQLPPGYASFPKGISIVAVVKPAKLGKYARVVDFGDGPNSGNIVLDLGEKPGTLAAYSYHKQQGGLKVEAPGAVVAGRWQQVAATIDPEGGAAVYVDGKAVATGTTGRLVDGPRPRCYIGQSNWNEGPGKGNDEMFAGSLRELRIYGRVLSAEEIAQEAARMPR